MFQRNECSILDTFEPPDLTIVIPSLREADNLRILIPQIHSLLRPLSLKVEIIVVDELADEETRSVVTGNRAILLSPDTRGYGSALQAGLSSARSDYVVSMDADLSHPPDFLIQLWEARQKADIIIASRYVPGGQADMPRSRMILSRILNTFFGLGLGMKVRDMSSGFRLYSKKAIFTQDARSKDFNMLQELLVRAALHGCSIAEIPFAYRPRIHGSSHARVFKFGISYLKTFLSLRRLRVSEKW